jgi:hypothetical protein
MSETRSIEDQKFIDDVMRIEEFACKVESVAVKLQRLAMLIRDPDIRVVVAWLLDHDFDVKAATAAMPDLVQKL